MRSLPPFFKIRCLIAVFAVVIFGFLPTARAGEDWKTSPSILVESGTGLISLEARDVEIAELLRSLSEKTKTDITVGEGVSGKITVKISDATIADVLKAIGQNTAIVYEYQPDTDGWSVLRGFSFSGSNADGTESPAGNGQTPASSGDTSKPHQTPKPPIAASVSAPVKPPPAQAPASADPGRKTPPAYKAGELLVKFKDGAPTQEIDALHARMGSVVIRTIPFFHVQRIRLKAGLDEGKAIAEYQKSAIVEYAERHALRYPQAIPNDPGYTYPDPGQWGMKKINAEALWNITTGNREIIVAVIDSGVDYKHPDLRDNIWVNTVELTGLDDVDDDPIGNVNDPGHIAYPDDIYGWDFAGATGAPDNDPMDSYGHGTHVAGIIGAVGNNGIGVTGLNWQVRIMPLKVMEDSSSSFTDAAILEALAYAQANGARVVNCSFGGTAPSISEYNAFNSLREKGIIATVAAGNYSHDMDREGKLYPACYAVDNIIKDESGKDIFCPGLDNIISVANSDSDDHLASLSNYGKTTVDLAAPGTSIYSTIPSSSSTAASVKTPIIATPYQAVAMEFSDITSDTGLTRTLVDCGMGYTDQIIETVAGQIALIQRGNRDGLAFYFSSKVLNAQAKGAEGVIIYNNVTPDEDPEDTLDTEGGTLQFPGNWPPVVSISRAIGEDILEGMENGMLQNVTLTNKPSTIAYDYMTGTSMAAPHVAGLAGMIFGRCPSIGYANVKAAIINTSDKSAALADKTVSGGRINAFAALASLFPPGDLSADCRIGLEDAIIALKIIAGIETPLACPLSDCTRHDIDNDGRITAAEGIYILQKIADLR